MTKKRPNKSAPTESEAPRWRREVEETWATYRDGTRELIDLTTRSLPDNEAAAKEEAKRNRYIHGARWEMERKAEEAKRRGPRTARSRKSKRETRDEAIGDFALSVLVSSSQALDADPLTESLADNPKKLPGYVLKHWRVEWGKPVKLPTLERILHEQRVATRLRESD